MPRPQSSQALTLTGGQAQYVLSRLISDRKILQRDVNECLSSMQRDIEELEERLNSLRAFADGTVSAAPTAAPRRAVFCIPPQPRPPVQRRRRQINVSPETLASRQLQGRYLGLIRQIPATKRAKFQKIAKASGREAAVRALRVTLGR